MNHYARLIKNGIAYMLLAYMLSDTLSAQHTIYPDLFIIGSDSLMELSLIHI